MLLYFSKLILFSFRKCGWLSVEGEMRRQASLFGCSQIIYKLDDTSGLLSVYIRVTNQIKKANSSRIFELFCTIFFLLLNVVPQYQVKKAQCCPSCTDSTDFCCLIIASLLVKSVFLFSEPSSSFKKLQQAEYISMCTQ